MNPSDLPQIKPGTQWWHTCARQWQNLFDLALRLANLRVGPGLQISNRGRFTTLRLTDDIQKPRPNVRRVAVVAYANAEANEEHDAVRKLIVREVRYASKPPREGEYRWHGPHMHVYPAVGHVLSDFATHLWGITPPTSATSILDAYRVDEEWFVPLPGGGDQIRYVVAVSIASPRVLTCRAVRRTPPAQPLAPVWDATWTITGEDEPIHVEPGLLATDYGSLMTPDPPTESSLPQSTAILPVTWYDGVWMVQQHILWSEDQPVGNVESGDCVP